jgi:hypothetical protein
MSGASTTANVIVHQIHFYLWPPESVKNARVCRTWQRILSDDIFWKRVCVIQQLAPIADLSYKQQALLLRAEALLNKKVISIQREQGVEQGIAYDEAAVFIEIDTFSKEMQMLCCEKNSLKPQAPPLFSWIPLKYFFKEGGVYKTQGDQMVVEYQKRDLLLTLCKEKNANNFCDDLKIKVEIGLAIGEVDGRHVEYVKMLAKHFITKVTIGK